MAHQLAGLGSRCSQPEPVNDVVQPLFKVQQQCLARNAFATHGLFKVVTKLVLQNLIEPPNLLLFPKLDPIPLGLGAARFSMLAWREVSLFNGTLVGQTALALQKELLPFPAAKPTYCFTISCQTNLL